MVPRPATKDIDSAPTWFVRSREDGYTFDSDNFRLHMEYERVNWNASIKANSGATTFKAVPNDMWHRVTMYISSPTLYLRSETDIKALEDIIAEIGRITTGVSTVMGNKNAHVTDIYTIDGKRIPALRHGVNIVRMSDGTVKKVVK